MAPVDAAVHRRAGIDVPMNFAKLGPSAPVRDRADDEWHAGMEVYCLDIVRPTRLVTPIMQGWSESAIVFSVAPIAISWRRTGQSSAHVGARAGSYIARGSYAVAPVRSATNSFARS